MTATDHMLKVFKNNLHHRGHPQMRHKQVWVKSRGKYRVSSQRKSTRGSQAEKVRFTSSILPRYLRKAKSVEELLPWLYSRAFRPAIFRKP